MVSLIAMLAMGILAGCTVGAKIKIPAEAEYLVTYCGNGGTINKKVERYMYMQKDAHAFNPGAENSKVAPVVNSVYRFVSWKVCKMDENGKPVLRDDPISYTDGGVWVTDNGAGDAIAESDKSNYKNVVHKYYDYEDTDWVFGRDRITENVILVAVWADYNKFIIADYNNGEWENLDVLTDDSFTFESNVYEQYADRLVNAVTDGGTKISDVAVRASYNAARQNSTALKFYYDKECENEMVFPIPADKLVTVVYYKEIEGIYDLGGSAKGFTDAVASNNNIYLLNDIDLGKYTVSDTVYGGIIKGNGFTLSGGKTEITQVHWTGTTRLGNTYGGIFGELDGATIYDVTINTTITFVIAVDPDAAFESQGSDVDRECYVGIFAKSMNNCTLSNVTINAEYEKTRTESYQSYFDENNEWIHGYFPNTYDVTVHFAGWQAVDSGNNTIVDDCAVNFAEKGDEQEGNSGEQTPGDDEGEQTPGGDEDQTPGETPNNPGEGDTDETEGDQGETETPDEE